MKKNYFLLIPLLVLFCTTTVNAQYFIPFTGSNTIPSGTVTLCTHAGCGVSYNNNANGYTVIYPGACAVSTTIIGVYSTESCCDDIFIYNGIGTTGTQLANYFGTGTFTFVSTPNQTLSIRFTSDGSVINTGLQATVITGPDLEVNNSVYDYTICSGKSVTLTAEGMDTYTWSPFILSNSLIASPMVSTIYTVSGTSTLGSGCTVDRTVSITVNVTPTISISGNTVVCGPGTNAQLSVNGTADHYLWNNGQTTPVITIAPLQHTTYSVTATNNVGGCQDSDVFTVAYSDNPIVSVTGNNLEVCKGNSVTLFANGASSYTWSTGSNNSVLQDAPTASTFYQVTGANQYGCVSSATIPVIVNPLPALTLIPGRDVMCPGESIELSVTGADKYEWTAPNYYMPTQTINTQLHVTTTFMITGTTSKGCTATITHEQTVIDCTALNETGKGSLLNLYPNPAGNSFNVAADSQINRITLHDVSGRQLLVSDLSANNHEVSLEGIPSGVYFVTIATVKDVQVVKLIKQ